MQEQQQQTSPLGQKTITVKETSTSSCIEFLVILCFWTATILCCPFICISGYVLNYYTVVKQYERAVVFRMGRLKEGGAQGPGTIFVLPCVDTCQVIDLRTKTYDVPPQEILTQDSVTVSVDAVVYYRVFLPTMAVANVENYQTATWLLALTTLRNVLGTKSLSEILSDRESISVLMQTALDEATDFWGVKVERVDIKDVRLPKQLQLAMAAEAGATREAKAKVIAADGEMKASQALKDAAQVLTQSPAALQLRYLQTLNTIAAVNSSTIVFPLEFLPTGK